MFEPNKILKLEKIFKIFTALDRPENSLFLMKNDLSKNDYIEHCTIISQNICHRSIRTNSNFYDYLKQSLDILLILCDHSDIDIRNAADDSLERICVTYKDLTRLQAEIFCEIDGNIKKRPLIVALKKFSDIVHCIKPTKYRVFAVKIFSCFIKITKRNDIFEIQELITECLQKICPILCPYASDKDLISLMNLYIPLLNNDIVSVRRSFALALSTVCQTSRRPHQFCQWLITNLLNQLSVEPTNDREMFVSGVFTTFKFLLSKIKSLIEQNLDDSIHEFFIENTLFIYQHLLSSLHYSKNNSVIVASFEALQEFFQNLSVIVLEKIINIDSKVKLNNYSKNDPMYSSNLSLGVLSQANSKNDQNFDDFFEHDDEHFTGAKLIGDDYSRLKRPTTSSSEYAESVILSDYDDSSSMFQDRSDTDSVYEDCKIEEFDIDKNRKSDDPTDGDKDNDNDRDQYPSSSSSDDLSSKSISENQNSNIEMMNFGEIYSLEWTCKLICAKFLLKGQKGQLYGSEIRSSIKILALNLLSQIIELYPDVMNLHFETNDQQQNLSDILLYSTDSDPNICSSIGVIISKLFQNHLKKIFIISEEKDKELSIGNLFNILKDLLANKSGICLKQTLIAIQNFYGDSLKNYELKKYSKELFPILLELNSNSYFLVKVELINLLSSSCKHLTSIDSNVWNVILEDIFMKFLFCDDHRVRNAAINGLINIINNANLVGNCFQEKDCHNKNQDNHDESVIEEELKEFLLKNFDTNKNFKNSLICKNLMLIIDLLLNNFPQTINNKVQLFAGITVFSNLVRCFPPAIHRRGWMMNDNQQSTNKFLQITAFFMDILEKNQFSVLFDIQVHSELICLLQQLFLSFYPDSQHQHSEDLLSKLLSSFYNHLLKILVCYVSIVESNSSYFITYSYILHSTNNLQIKKILHKAKQKSLKDKNSILYIRRLLLSSGSKRNEAKIYEPIYYKVYEFLRSNYKNFKSFSNNVNKNHLLSCCLEAFGSLLKFNQINRKYLFYEQILFYFNILFELEPVKIIFCVKELLKFIFNYDTEYEEKNSVDSLQNNEDLNNFYNTVIIKPYNEMNNLYRNVSTNNLDIIENEKHSKYLESKNLENEMIFFFEPLVIESLKNYVNSNDKQLQCECIELLTVLLKLRINFNELDLNGTLIKCFYKQFDMMENIHDSKQYEHLMRQLFRFLILVSETCRSTPNVELISVPKLIQFCDIFIANNHQNLAAIGLEVLAEELFCKNSLTIQYTFNTDLDAEREVLLAYCFKLIHIPDILKTLVKISRYYFDKERYREISGKIFDQLKMKIMTISLNNIEQFHNFSSLLFSLNRSINNDKAIFELIFEDISHISGQNSVTNQLNSISRIMNLSMFVLFTLSETDIFQRIEEFLTKNDESSEMSFVKQLWKLFHVGFNILLDVKNFVEDSYLVFLLTRLSFLMTFLYQCGHFPKLTSTSIRMFVERSPEKNSTLPNLESLFHRSIERYPLLTMGWLNTVFVLNSEQFYPLLRRIIFNTKHKDPVVKRFGIIFCCDFLTEAIEDNSLTVISDDLQALFGDSIVDVIEMFDNHVPVKEFLNSVQRHSISSSMLLKSVDRTFEKNTFRASFCLKTLKCVERIHQNESYSLIRFLLKYFILNKNTRIYLGCCKMAENMIISRFEIILQEYDNDKDSMKILSLKAIKNLKTVLKRTPFFKLNNYIDKFLVKAYLNRNSSSRTSLISSKNIPLNDPLNVSFSNETSIQPKEINREWFNDLLKAHFSVKQNDHQKSEYFFTKLSIDDITSLMNCPQFMISNQCHIIDFTINSILNQNSELTCLNYKSKNNNSSFHLEAKKRLVCNILDWNLSYMKFIVELDSQPNRAYVLKHALQLYIPTLSKFIEHLHKLESFVSCTNITDNDLELKILIIYSEHMASLSDDVLEMFIKYLFNEQLFTKLTNVQYYAYQSTFVGWIYDLFNSYFGTSNRTKQQTNLCEMIENKQYQETVKQLLELFSIIENGHHLTSNKHSSQKNLYCFEKIIMKLCHTPLVHSLLFIAPNIYEQISHEQSSRESRFTGQYGTDCQMDNFPEYYSSDPDALRQLQYRIECLALNSLEFAGEIWNMLLQIFSMITEQLHRVNMDDDRNKRDVNDVIETLLECIKTMTKMIHFGSIFGHVYIEQRYDNVFNIHDSLSFNSDCITIDPRWGTRAEFILKFLRQEENKLLKNTVFYRRQNCQTLLSPGCKIYHRLRSPNFDMFIDSSCPLFMIEEFHHQIERMSRDGFLPFPVIAEMMRSTTVLIQSVPSNIAEHSISAQRLTNDHNEYYSEQLQSQWTLLSSWIDRGTALINDIWRQAELYDDKIIESLFVINYVKLFMLINHRSDCFVQTFTQNNLDKFRKNLFDNCSRDFYFPLRIAALKSIVIGCSTPCSVPFFTDHDGKSIESLIKFNYEHLLPNHTFEKIQWKLISRIFSNRSINNIINKQFQKEMLQIMMKNISKKHCKNVCQALECFCLFVNYQYRMIKQQSHGFYYQNQQQNVKQNTILQHQKQQQQQQHQQQQQNQSSHNYHLTNESSIYCEETIKQINELSLNQLINCQHPDDRIALLKLYISSLYIVTTLGNATNNSSKRTKLLLSPMDSSATLFEPSSVSTQLSSSSSSSPERISISDNETLFSVMEQLSVIFDLLTNCNTAEATLFCQILGHFLVDFFSAPDLLNKCIGQFLSNQQNHYKHLTNVLFVIFNKFQNDFLNIDTAQDWVVLSLSSFTQVVPVSHSLWSLTCFFAAASQNHWIRASFPAFQERFGQFDCSDQEQFMIVCNNFFNEIKSTENQTAFIKTFQQASSQLSNSPYFEVLKYLNKL